MRGESPDDWFSCLGGKRNLKRLAECFTWTWSDLRILLCADKFALLAFFDDLLLDRGGDAAVPR